MLSFVKQTKLIMTNKKMVYIIKFRKFDIFLYFLRQCALDSISVLELSTNFSFSFSSEKKFYSDINVNVPFVAL